MTDTEWINKADANHGLGGNPNVHWAMQFAIRRKAERCAKIAESNRPGDNIARAIAALIRNKE